MAEETTHVFTQRGRILLLYTGLHAGEQLLRGRVMQKASEITDLFPFLPRKKAMEKQKVRPLAAKGKGWTFGYRQSLGHGLPVEIMGYGSGHNGTSVTL